MKGPVQLSTGLFYFSTMMPFSILYSYIPAFDLKIVLSESVFFILGKGSGLYLSVFKNQKFIWRTNAMILIRSQHRNEQ